MGAYSSAVNPARSFRSAPAQKQLSTSEVKINALVGPLSSTPAAPPNRFSGGISSPFVSYSPATASTCERNSHNSCLEIAFRAEGRARDSIRIRPPPVRALTSTTFIRGVGCDEYRRISSFGSVKV